MTNSDTAMNPDGGAVDWRCAIQPALETNLMERVVESQNVYQAWVRVRSNKGAPGIDDMPIEDFADYARREWATIRQSLLDGSYQPTAVRRVSIPKPGGGERNLEVPCVLDRVIQQAILQVLTPLFDPEFSESSFGSRPKRSAHGAINQVKGFIKAGYRIAVDLDLEEFLTMFSTTC